MESQFLPDKEIPPVPLKTYQWEDLRRARDAGGYPWTYLLKPPLEGEITAEDILRESTPKRSMSREFSRSRTHSPAGDDQRILNLDSSPGSSRRHGEEGEDEGVHVPNFSKEVSLDSDDDVTKMATNASYMTDIKQPDAQSTSHLATSIEVPKNVSPKGILKRRGPENQFIGITETREKTKCCHPLVNKIKHLADKTLQKLSENDKSPLSKRKKNDETQEIRQLKTSPGAVRRQKFSAIKLGDSDEMSKTMSVDSSTPNKRKDHIYEDIDESKNCEEKSLHFSPDVETMKYESENTKENDSLMEKKSNASQDPSLVADEITELKPEEHIMEKLHKLDDINKEAVILDDDVDEPNVDEIFQNQLEESLPKDGSPNITITEITDDIEIPVETALEPRIDSSPSPQEDVADKHSNVSDITGDWSKTSSKLRRWTSEGGDPLQKPLRPTREGSVQSYTPDVRCGCQYFQSDSLLPERINPVGTRPTSRASNIISNVSDHEYEIIEKPHSNMQFSGHDISDKPIIIKTDDELSSTTSIERKYLQHHSDDDEQEGKERYSDYKDDRLSSAEALQKNIEDQYFSNTPSVVSRTECDVSTSQVDSSALENLPLKRDSRKNFDSMDSKIQQRIKEGTGKLKSQAGKLKTKLQNIKASMPEKPKFSLPERPKFKMPERPKINLPERPKFTLPDKRKFSLPDRPKFKKINISEKLSLGDRKKFTMPDRPKFNVPDLPKFKLPDRPKINFSSFGRKKDYKQRAEPASSESSSDLRNIAPVEFESKTFPRLFNRKKKTLDSTASSSPAIDREDTPPPVFTFTRVKKISIPRPVSPETPREYGQTVDNEFDERRQIDETYDFDKVEEEYINEGAESYNLDNKRNGSSSVPDISPNKQEYSHVINEINNDEFFVRPRGISRENIQVREYLSDEIRQAFIIPKNALSMMGGTSRDTAELMYANDVEADPELLMDDNEPMRYSNEDLNDKDDGYYTFPPVRPSRAKRKKKELDSVHYIDESVHASLQFSEVDLGLSEDQVDELHADVNIINEQIVDENKQMETYANEQDNSDGLNNTSYYVNGDMNNHQDIPVQSQTLPMPPKRKKKSKNDILHSSYNDFRDMPSENVWEEPDEQIEDIIVYRTEHEYIVPQTETVATERSPLPPQRSRNRSRSSRGTSLCDDDRTSHGAESLTLDTHIPHVEDVEIEREIRHESPGYATVDKSPYAPSKTLRRSKSKTPPVRRRKSSGSDPKYHTVGPTRAIMPDRPPRKKSSTSLMTLDSIKRSNSGDITQYDEIDEPPFDEIHKDLVSGEIINRMKDRPLPAPPRPPRGSRKKRSLEDEDWKTKSDNNLEFNNVTATENEVKSEEIVEIEVSTQTDPLPDDVDYELGMEENLDISMSSSIRDIVCEDHINAFRSKQVESPHISRPTSRSEKSFKLSDPKISELSKSTLGRTSPTVILVEKRVSSPTRINEHEEMLTEASLTVQHIDVDESKIPDVPPLPMPRGSSSAKQSSKTAMPNSNERALEKLSDVSRDIQLDNLVTQRLQVRDLDVGRLNVSELQASKILVSDIEGMTLQVTELDSKSGHISVSGIEFSQNIIDEIVKKFAELSAPSTSTIQHSEVGVEHIRPVSREEETQTDKLSEEFKETKGPIDDQSMPCPQTKSANAEETASPPQRPPPPDLTPLLYSYLQDLTVPSSSLYHTRGPRERPFTDFHETQHPSPPPPTRRVKRKPTHTAPHSESSSDDSRPRPSSPRRIPAPVKAYEPTISEAGAHFLRVCHNSISRTLRNMFNSFMSYISGTEDKKDVQMALVIFLVLIAGLIMFGLSDSRTIHHHHWEFFNPPEGKP